MEGDDWVESNLGGKKRDKDAGGELMSNCCRLCYYGLEVGVVVDFQGIEVSMSRPCNRPRKFMA